jgi:hypothetical protein
MGDSLTSARAHVSALSMLLSISLLRALDDSRSFQLNITMLAGQTDGMNKTRSRFIKSLTKSSHEHTIST